MAHFAEMKDNKVEQVIVIANDNCDNLPFPESEPVGQAFIAELGLPGEWLQTSYNGSFRNLFAGIGFSFDPTVGEYGAFVPPTFE
jgi:hypothetical protein